VASVTELGFGKRQNVVSNHLEGTILEMTLFFKMYAGLPN
jgi:hypothetical protein